MKPHKHISLLLTTAIAAAALSPRPLHAASTWINPNDPTGTGTDIQAALHLTGSYETATHWSPSGTPASSVTVLFNAPGYPATAYTVSFAQSETANNNTFSNPVSFNLNTHTYTLTQTTNAFNNISLLIATHASLTVKNGTLTAQNIQVGASTNTLTSNTFLAVDGSAGAASLLTANNTTLSNYQNIKVTNNGLLQIGNNSLINQAPDLQSGGFNVANISLSSGGTLALGNNVTLRGGSLSTNLGDGSIQPLGTSLTYDSLYLDADFSLNNTAFTMNFASSLTDPHDNNTVIPTTITGALNVGNGTVNILNSTLLLTPDGGSSWTPFTITGFTHLNLNHAIIEAGATILDGAPFTGSTSSISSSTLTLHGDLTLANLGNAQADITGTNSMLFVDGSLIVASQPAITGTLSLDGPSTFISVGMNPLIGPAGPGNLLIGNSGTALVSLTNGAAIYANSPGFMVVGVTDNGDGTGGAGTLTVSGAGIDVHQNTVQSTVDLLNGSSDMYVGSQNHSRGTVLITNGGYIADLNAHIAMNPGSSGSVLVDGGYLNPDTAVTASSQWLHAGSLTIGDGGTALLTVSNGAIVNTGTSLLIANHSASTGSVTLSSFSILSVNESADPASALTVGVQGHARLDVLSGSAVNVVGNTLLAANAGSTAILTLDGDALLNTSADLTIGNAGAGSLTLQNNSAISNANAYVGRYAGSTGIASVSSSSWLSSAGFFIAANDSANNPGHQILAAGTGTVTLAQGASLSAASALIGTAGVLNMQGGSFSAPTLTLNGLLHGGGNLFTSITGTGTVQADTATSLITGPLQIPSLLINGSLTLRPATGTSKIQSFSLATSSPNTFTATLDLTNNKLILQSDPTIPTDKSTKLTLLRSAITSGLSTGTGLTSTALTPPTTLALVDNALYSTPKTTFGGQTVDANSLLVTYALKGDTDLSGTVDFADLTALLQSYNSPQSTRDWTKGNFSNTYSNASPSNFADLTALLQNYTHSLAGFGLEPDPLSSFTLHPSAFSPSPVPEPTSLALLTLGALALSKRSRVKHYPLFPSQSVDFTAAKPISRTVRKLL